LQNQNQAKELYTEKASLYDRFFIGFLGWGKQLETFFQKTNYLHSNLKVLDAGCGTGVITRTLYELAQEKCYEGLEFHAFDLSASMLEIFQQWIKEQGVNGIEFAEADVLKIEALQPNWKEYDLIVTSTMLEYLPRPEVKNALVNLKNLLKDDGILLVFITKRNLITRWLAGRWWKANLYTKSEIQRALEDADFGQITFKRFTKWWSSAILVIEAKK
jgi:ubiquinone/menaquinone biosynthesis C-methylase UbiE